MSASLILWERAPRWIAALRREMRKSSPAPQFPLVEVRSQVQCQRELEAAPYSLVAVEVTPQNLLAVAKAISVWSRRCPKAVFLVLAARGLRQHELLLREMGASYYADSPRSLGPVIRIARRYLALAPKKRQTLDEAIWADLPWVTPATRPAAQSP